MSAAKTVLTIPGPLGADLAAAARERAVGRNLLAELIIEHWLNNAPDPALMLQAVAPITMLTIESESQEPTK